MEEEDFDPGIVADPLGTDVEGPLGCFYRDHLHATRENIVTAGVVEVRSRDQARRGGSAGCDPCADGQRKKDGGHREETAHSYLPWKRAARDGWIGIIACAAVEIHSPIPKATRPSAWL